MPIVILEIAAGLVAAKVIMLPAGSEIKRLEMSMLSYPFTPTTKTAIGVSVAIFKVAVVLDCVVILFSTSLKTNGTFWVVVS